MTLMNLAGCNGIDEAHWTEEVKLHDGKMIVVERVARARHSGFPNASRGRDIDFELKYPPMNVSWHGDALRPPVAFEVFDGVPYLVLYTGDRNFCLNKDPKRYLAQFLRWRSGVWTEIGQHEFPTDIALMNLYGDYWGHNSEGDAKGLIKWRDKFGEYPESVKSWFERNSQTCHFYQQLAPITGK